MKIRLNISRQKTLMITVLCFAFAFTATAAFATLTFSESYVNFGDTSGSGGYGIRDNGGTVEFKNSGGAWTNVATASNYWSRTGTTLSTATAGDNITTTGQVGIGTASPGAKIHSLSTTEQLRLGYDASNYNSFTVDATGNLTIAATGTNPNITITPGGTGATILNGKVGIGTTDLISGVSLTVTSMAVPEIIKASTTPLTAGEVANTQINNYGQAAEATLTLPVAISGYRFVVRLGTAGKPLHLKPSGTDVVYLDGIALTAGNKISNNGASALVGDTIVLQTFETGANSWSWEANSVVGIWVDGGI